MTSIIPVVTELGMLGVIEPGAPNRERIALKPYTFLDLGGYAMILGLQGPALNLIQPIKDALFWFGSGNVGPNDWLYLFTGEGNPVATPFGETGGNLYSFFWGHRQTVFHDPRLVPVLIRLGGFVAGAPSQRALPSAPQ